MTTLLLAKLIGSLVAVILLAYAIYWATMFFGIYCESDEDEDNCGEF